MTQSAAFAPSESVMRWIIVKVLFLISFAVLIPGPVMSAFGFGSAGSFIGLAGVGAVTAVLIAGVRVAVISAPIAGFAAALLVLASVTWWSAALVMMLVALVFGLTARKGWQGGFVSAVIGLSFIASDGAKVVVPLERAAVALGLGILLWGLIVAAVSYLFFRKPVLPVKPEPPRTVLGYIVMLMVVTCITQSLAISMDLGHMGGWLVMTPFLVILPHIHDGFRKSLRRAAGTIVGFLFVLVVASLIPSTPILSIIGTAAFTAAIYAKFKNWNYFVFSALLTPGIVILEGASSSSLTTVADERLTATLGAIALSLAAMGITTVIGRTLPPARTD
jgi:hypothetical protein